MSEGPRASCVCKSDKKTTRFAFLLFLGIALLLVVLLILDAVPLVVGQAITLISLVISAYIFIRYIATSYRYEILADEEGDILSVVRVQGKRELIQRQLSLSSLIAIYEIKSNSRSAEDRPNLPVINYSSHLMADEYTLLHFGGEEPILLRINADGEFLTTLSTYLSQEENDEDD